MSSIYSEQQLSSITLGLEKGDLSVKYAYMTDVGSKSWNAIEKARVESGKSFSDGTMLKNTIDLYLQELGVNGELTIFDFGCGGGETVKTTLDKLIGMGISINYHAFDISENIISLCKKNLSELQGLHFDYDIIDFETSNLISILHDVRSKYNNSPVLGLLLGNTIGNFPSMERVLSNITEAFRLQDKLVVGIERADVQNQKRYDQMIKEYNSDTVATLVLSTLEELGVATSLGSFYSTFDHSKKLIEMFWKLNEDISLSVASSEIIFQEGERIRVAISQKVDEEKLSQIVSDLDLRIANSRTNPSNSYLQVLLSSKRK